MPGHSLEHLQTLGDHFRAGAVSRNDCDLIFIFKLLAKLMSFPFLFPLDLGPRSPVPLLFLNMSDQSAVINNSCIKGGIGSAWNFFSEGRSSMIPVLDIDPDLIPGFGSAVRPPGIQI